MKHPFLHNLYAFAILLFLFMTGCRNHSPVATKLQQAETCMYESPDSALSLLKSIPHPERLTGQAQADYALLMTQARSRCRITATSDSLIQVAVRYYQPSHDNARKAHSYLYLADVYMDMKKYTEAIIPLKKAEEMLEDAAPYIQSLTYSKLGYLNRRSGNNQMAFGYYQKAKAINLSMNHQEWYISNLVNILNLPLQEVRDSVTVYIEELEEVLFTARPDLQAKAYNNIGIYYHDKERWGLAEQYYRERRIPVQYAKRMVGRKMYGGQSTHIPMKINSTGVMPLIFGFAILQFPATLFAFFPTSGLNLWWMSFQNGIWYQFVLALLIVAFTYFYTSITFNPVDISKNMQQNGGLIPGIRQGRATSDYLGKVSGRLTLFSALFLAVLATIPTLITRLFGIQAPFAASSVLIAVSVGIETIRQIEAQMVMRHHKGFL